MTQPGNRLPVVGSTASSTAFCYERIDGLDGTYLFIDGNGKITGSNGTLHSPRPNAFSLPAAGISGIEHCPQSTETCRKACYVGSLGAAQPDLYAMYEENAQNIRRILADEYLANDWAMRLAHWISQNASGGFRWHVSGDLFSMEYAQWIADVCREAPSVRFWIYTRSFDFLEPLEKVSTLRGGNLAINLSCDRDNYEAAKKAADAYKVFSHNDVVGDGMTPEIVDVYDRLRLCYLVVGADEELPIELEEDDVIFPDLALRPRQFATLAESPWWQSIEPFERGLVCPVDAHNKSERNRCGLDRCSRCLK